MEEGPGRAGPAGRRGGSPSRGSTSSATPLTPQGSSTRPSPTRRPAAAALASIARSSCSVSARSVACSCRADPARSSSAPRRVRCRRAAGAGRSPGPRGRTRPRRARPACSAALWPRSGTRACAGRRRSASTRRDHRPRHGHRLQRSLGANPPASALSCTRPSPRRSWARTAECPAMRSRATSSAASASTARRVSASCSRAVHGRLGLRSPVSGKWRGPPPPLAGGRAERVESDTERCQALGVHGRRMRPL